MSTKKNSLKAPAISITPDEQSIQIQNDLLNVLYIIANEIPLTAACPTEYMIRVPLVNGSRNKRALALACKVVDIAFAQCNGFEMLSYEVQTDMPSGSFPSDCQLIKNQLNGFLNLPLIKNRTVIFFTLCKFFDEAIGQTVLSSIFEGELGDELLARYAQVSVSTVRRKLDDKSNKHIDIVLYEVLKKHKAHFQLCIDKLLGTDLASKGGDSNCEKSPSNSGENMRDELSPFQSNSGGRDSHEK